MIEEQSFIKSMNILMRHEGEHYLYYIELLLVYEHLKMSFHFCSIFMEEKDNRLHSKQCWVISTQIWVKYGQTQMLG